jgi:glycerol-1-phosphate dehydrogenase [NAD(P)+]
MVMTVEISQKPLNELLGLHIEDCACGKTHHVPTREVADRLDDLTGLVERWIPAGALICVVDANTFKAAGEQAVAMIRKSGREVWLYRADENSAEVHADGPAVAALESAVKRYAAVGILAVGSGTINDICKTAATRAGCPLVTVATAASMNGYPSAISALSVGGVKITEPCVPPVAIVADPDILATAPPEMNRAGFGDLLSKNASTADWVMSHLLHGEYFCPLPAAVADAALQRCITGAAAIRTRQPQGLQVLIEALLRSGIAMVLAGSSAPASGGEHLISHLWDMSAHWTNRTPALHGEQTGVTTLISLALYQKLLEMDTEALQRCRPQPPFASRQAFESEMHRVFKDLAEAVLPHARQKFLDANGLQRRRNHILAHWDSIRRAVSAVVIPPQRSREHLLAVGAKVRAAELGISDAELAFSYRYARWIRNRYCVLDLAAEIGVLDALEDMVLAEV